MLYADYPPAMNNRSKKYYVDIQDMRLSASSAQLLLWRVLAVSDTKWTYRATHVSVLLA